MHRGVQAATGTKLGGDLVISGDTNEITTTHNISTNSYACPIHSPSLFTAVVRVHTTALHFAPSSLSVVLKVRLVVRLVRLSVVLKLRVFRIRLSVVFELVLTQGALAITWGDLDQIREKGFSVWAHDQQMEKLKERLRAEVLSDKKMSESDESL